MVRVVWPLSVAMVLLALPAPPVADEASATTWVELRRWEESSLGPHTNVVFELDPDELFTDYFFKVNPPGPSISDVAAGVMRVRVVSTPIVVCVGFAADTGETNDKLQKCDGLLTQHTYHLDWMVQDPRVSLSLIGQNNLP